jgi:hypothetical protein
MRRTAAGLGDVACTLTLVRLLLSLWFARATAAVLRRPHRRAGWLQHECLCFCMLGRLSELHEPMTMYCMERTAWPVACKF